MNRILQFQKKIRQEKPHRILAVATLLLFPLVLVLTVETTHIQSLGEVLRFLTGSPLILLYDLLLVSALFAALFLLLRQAWLAMFLEGGALYALALVEYFKFEANGTHFSVADLVMAGKISDLSRFASIRPNTAILLCLAVLVLYALWTAFLGVRVRLRPARVVGVCSLGLVIAFLCVPGVSKPVYQWFGVDMLRTGSGAYAADQAFQQNMQIAYLSQNLSSEVARSMAKPADSSRQAVEAVLPRTGTLGGAQRPDLILVMSESYTDLRRFGVEAPEGTYDQFDRLSGEGALGQTLVPTFGGYTCKTEFELLFGLPVKGIYDESIPHQKFTDGAARPTVAAYLKDLGYATSFVHPFSPSFYNRDKAYPAYGFDRALFEDDLTVPVTRMGDYADDYTLTRQILEELDRSEGPAFVYAVSMQNHGPYQAEAGDRVEDPRLNQAEQEELGRYLRGVAETDKALGELAEALRQRGRPAVLVFVGDHYPYLGKQAGMYRKLTGDTSGDALYRQTYLMWSVGLEGEDQLPEERVSSFWLPHLMIDRAGLPKDRFFSAMWEIMQRTPEFSMENGADSADTSALMLLTYDRTSGDQWSDGMERTVRIRGIRNDS